MLLNALIRSHFWWHQRERVERAGGVSAMQKNAYLLQDDTFSYVLCCALVPLDSTPSYSLLFLLPLQSQGR